MPGAGPDPFELVKADIQDSLARAQTDFGQWQSSRASPGKRAELSGSIEDECKSMAWQVTNFSAQWQRPLSGDLCQALRSSAVRCVGCAADGPAC
jgi:hypothetical protein